jgi:thiamine biosynthesis protein ThiS
MAMELYLNGKREEIKDNMTISSLLEEKKIKPEVVTVELNNSIVARILQSGRQH